MAILPRHLMRQYLPVFALCVLVCTWVMLMNQFILLFNLAVLKGISPAWILGCFARLVPYFLSMAVPIAYLVSLLIALGQHSESGEVLALRSSGFSFREMLWPYFALAVALSAGLFYVNHKASPEGYHSFKKSYESAVRQVSSVDLEPGALNPFGQWKMFAREVDRASGRLGKVYLVKLRDPHHGLRVEAPEGRLSIERGRGFNLELARGVVLMPDQEPSRFISASFERYRLFVPLSIPEKVERDLDMQELNTPRLKERLADPGLAESRRKEYLTEVSLRSVGALTPFIFFWIGCPLGLILDKQARAKGFALSLLVLLAYYGLTALGIGLGRRQLAFSSAAPWLPAAAGLAAGAALWLRNLRR